MAPTCSCNHVLWPFRLHSPFMTPFARHLWPNAASLPDLTFDEHVIVSGCFRSFGAGRHATQLQATNWPPMQNSTNVMYPAQWISSSPPDLTAVIWCREQVLQTMMLRSSPHRGLPGPSVMVDCSLSREGCLTHQQINSHDACELP